MKVGDRVRLARGNPFGKVGTITFVMPLTGPVNLTSNPNALDTTQPVKHFVVKADDGTEFSAAEDQLELVA